MRSIAISLMLWAIVHGLCAQTAVNITIVHDGDRGTNDFLTLVQQEIDVLLGQQYNIKYNDLSLINPQLSPVEIVQSTLDDAHTKVLITLGLTSSGALSSIDDYPIPSIAGISLEQLATESTGIHNYTLVQSPFSVDKDLEVFQSIYPFKNLAIFIRPNLKAAITPFISSFADGFDIQYIDITDDPLSDLNKLTDEVDAIYVLPNLYENQADYITLIDGINDRKLPSFSMIGRDDVENGILASISSSEYIGVYARRIALNVMKILEGQNPKDFPIRVDGIEDDFIINAGTMDLLGVYPPLEVLSLASLINLQSHTGKKYTLQSAIAEALDNNISFQSAKMEVDIQKTEIGIANANLLPTLEASSTLVTLDGYSADLIVASNQATPQTEWAGNLALSQLIYSQPTWANLSIQKSLLRAEESGLMSQQLDLVLDVCLSYLSCLQAQANRDIQNTNVQTTLSNLNIAKTKTKIGSLSNADVYGFESQLATNKSALNDANTGLQQAKISFNQLLNRPLDEAFVLEDVQSRNDLFFIHDSRISEKISNQYDIRKFSEFLIESAIINAPELDQLRWSTKAQESSLESNRKSRYLPQVVLQGGLDKTFGRYGIKVPDTQFDGTGVELYKPTWNVALNASLPIFQGNLRTKKIQKDIILLDQLELSRASLEQQFATNIKLSLENLGNSFNDIRFTQQAEKSSSQYLGIVQDLYREGVSNIVTLLDAQNNALSAKLGAVSSRYQFIIDAITLERLYNKIYLLSTPEERESFISDYFTFLTKKENNE